MYVGKISNPQSTTSLLSSDQDYGDLPTVIELNELACLVSEIAVALTMGPDLRSSLRLCTEALVRHLGAAFARIWTLSEGESVLELQASAGMYTSIEGTHRHVQVGQFKIGLIAQECKPHITNAVIGDPRVHDQEWACREGLVAFAGHPLVVEGRVVGVMALFSRHLLTEATENALATAAHSIATGIAHWQAVDTLRASNERFELVIQATDEGIWDWNIVSDEAYVSPRLEELLGYEERESASNAFLAFESRLHPSDRDRTLGALQDHLQNRRAFREDCRLLNPRSGEYHWFHVRGQARWDPAGRPTRMLGSVCDINGRKHSEACHTALHRVTTILAESIELPRALHDILMSVCENLEWSIGEYWVVDNEAQVLRCKDVWHEPGLPVADFVAVSRGMAFSPGIGLPGRTWSRARPAWIEDVVRDANFPRAKVAAQGNLHGAIAFPIMCGDEVHGVMEFFSSKIREPDELLLDIIEDIASQISRHLALCEKKQIIQSQQQELAVAERMKEANRHKDTFLATLAHELRNPLSPISNALQLWPFKLHDPVEMDKLRQIMERQVKQLVKLINDLMDVSRISGGKLRLERCAIDLGTTMSHAVETILAAVDTNGQQLIFIPPVEPVTVTADPARLVQVFANLLHNACKYTGTGGVIHFTGERRGDTIVVTVKDNGLGISEEMLPKIFHMYCQVDQTLERSHGGLGIGLSLAEELVLLHGGSIEARSEGLGQGAEFIVTVPTAAMPCVTTPTGASQDASKVDGGLIKRQLLVVDDWEEVADTMAMMLRVIGQDVVTLNDGRLVIDWITTHWTDVAFIDIAMPGMNGHQIARSIREQPGLDHIVLVAMTGFGQQKDRRQALEAGFDHYLTKPVDLPAMQQLLSDLRRNGRRGKKNLHAVQSR